MTREFAGIAGIVQRRLRTTIGKRFSRFVVAAAAALGANQITLTICLGILRWSAGLSAVTAWTVSAAVSYLVSRWAWERKGRPSVVRETLPFWAVSIGSLIVLTTATKLANQQALSMHLPVAKRVFFDDSVNLGANCFTFLSRFLIFHYVLFKDRRPGLAVPAVAGQGPDAPLPSPAGAEWASPAGDVPAGGAGEAGLVPPARGAARGAEPPSTAGQPAAAAAADAVAQPLVISGAGATDQP